MTTRRLLGVLLTACLWWSLGPQAAAEERATLIATGRILLHGDQEAERVKYVHDGCPSEDLDGITASFLNVSSYRGKTLRIHGGKADIAVSIPFLWRGGTGVVVREGAECSVNGALSAKVRGFPWEGKPLTIVVTGEFLVFAALGMLTAGQHFTVEVIEEI